MSEWQTISDRPDIDHQPGRQFIRVEGSRFHSGVTWARVWCGEAFIRKPGTEGERLQYRKEDIDRIIRDGDMDEWSAEVTHWMPAVFPPIG